MLTIRRKSGARRHWLLPRRHRVILAAGLLFTLASLTWLSLTPRLVFAAEAAAPSPLAPVSLPTRESDRGAGGIGEATLLPRTPTTPMTARDLCNPLDPTCFAQGIATWLATQLQHGLQPITDAILRNPADIVFQTPLDPHSELTQTLERINTLFIGIVDLALASLLAIGAYNVIIAHHTGMLHASLTEVLPRAILVACAVHFNQFFLGLFIDFENQLTLVVMRAAGVSILTNLIAGQFSNPLTGWVTFVLIVVLAVLVVLLLIQMIARFGLVALTFALAPLGLSCLLLPQSMRWGRLWLTVFASSVMVQFVQVTALALGGVLISAVASTSFLRLDQELATTFLAIGVMGLVLKIPGLLQHWALHPMMEGPGGGSGQGSGDSSGGSMGGGSAEAGTGSAMGESVGGSQIAEGTIVTEESGTLLLLF